MNKDKAIDVQDDDIMEASSFIQSLKAQSMQSSDMSARLYFNTL